MMKSLYMKGLLAAGTVACSMSFGTVMAHADEKELTLCWAAWDPANALVELSKGFEASSGIKMKFEFVPWPNFADRMLNEEGITLLTGIVLAGYFAFYVLAIREQRASASPGKPRLPCDRC